MRSISLLLLGFLVSCRSQPFASFKPLLEKAPTQKVILLSCIRCNCIIEDLNKLIEEKNPQLEGYSFMGDTTCLSHFTWKDKVIPVPQAALDSLSMDLYNMLIYKNGRIKLVKTEKSGEMEREL